jgi:serine/threonine protein kinase
MSEPARPHATRVRLPPTGVGVPFPSEPGASGKMRAAAFEPSGYKQCPKCGDRFPLDFRVCPRDAVDLEEAHDAEDDPYVGKVVGDLYRITRRVGEGGMGRVYEAHHVRLPGRRFAVKIMHRAHLRSAELVRRFRREAETAHTAAHPNVVQVFDVADTPDGAPFIVTELLEGEDLADRLEREGKLGLDETIHVVRSVCAALSGAHAQGVVHRDLKPDNVFLLDRARMGLPPGPPLVKLIDFGIARVEETHEANRTRTGVIMGTPAFMAPEQARGERVDQRADVYAVGAILYRCLTGKLPITGDDPASMLTALLTHEPEHPRAIAPEIPQSVELVIERAMARDPADRWASLEELDEALSLLRGAPMGNAWLDPHTGEVSTTEEVAPRSGRVVHRARPKLLLVTLVGLLVLAGVSIDVVVRLLELVWHVELGRPEAMLVIGATAVGLSTPLWLWVRFLRQRVWKNSTRAIMVADRVATALGAAATAWVLVQLAGRVVQLAERESTVYFVPSVDPWLTFVAAGAAALFAIIGAAIRPRVAMLER